MPDRKEGGLWKKVKYGAAVAATAMAIGPDSGPTQQQVLDAVRTSVPPVTSIEGPRDGEEVSEKQFYNPQEIGRQLTHVRDLVHPTARVADAGREIDNPEIDDVVFNVFWGKKEKNFGSEEFEGMARGEGDTIEFEGDKFPLRIQLGRDEESGAEILLAYVEYLNENQAAHFNQVRFTLGHQNGLVAMIGIHGKDYEKWQKEGSGVFVVPLDERFNEEGYNVVSPVPREKLSELQITLDLSKVDEQGMELQEEGTVGFGAEAQRFQRESNFVNLDVLKDVEYVRDLVHPQDRSESLNPRPEEDETVFDITWHKRGLGSESRGDGNKVDTDDNRADEFGKDPNVQLHMSLYKTGDIQFINMGIDKAVGDTFKPENVLLTITTKDGVQITREFSGEEFEAWDSDEDGKAGFILPTNKDLDGIRGKNVLQFMGIDRYEKISISAWEGDGVGWQDAKKIVSFDMRAVPFKDYTDK